MQKNARILIACEESGVVTKAFRDLGFTNVWSCDIEPTSGEYPEWHLQQDVIPLLDEKWDMIIAFPPCTHLAVSGAAWFKEKRKDGRQQQGIDFFMKFANADCNKIAIENPVGIMSTIWRKPDQIINPWQFGHSINKKTCLWLKGLPLLMPTKIVEKEMTIKTKSGKTETPWHIETWKMKPQERAKIRSKTFQGIADAIANQYSIID